MKKKKKKEDWTDIPTKTLVESRDFDILSNLYVIDHETKTQVFFFFKKKKTKTYNPSLPGLDGWMEFQIFYFKYSSENNPK